MEMMSVMRERVRQWRSE